MNLSHPKNIKDFPIQKSNDEWKLILTPMQFHVTREKGTERAFTGELNENYNKGNYICIGCGNKLFTSSEKFNSGSGWPSFWKPVEDSVIAIEEDSSHGMTRTEVLCSQCGSHLGHVFSDGPRPTGLRYCINSASLKFMEI